MAAEKVLWQYEWRRLLIDQQGFVESTESLSSDRENIG